MMSKLENNCLMANGGIFTIILKILSQLFGKAQSADIRMTIIRLMMKMVGPEHNNPIISRIEKSNNRFKEKMKNLHIHGYYDPPQNDKSSKNKKPDHSTYLGVVNYYLLKMYIRQVKFESDNQDTDSEDEGIPVQNSKVMLSEEIKQILVMLEECLVQGGPSIKSTLQIVSFQENFYKGIQKYQYKPQESETKDEELKVQRLAFMEFISTLNEQFNNKKKKSFGH